MMAGLSPRELTFSDAKELGPVKLAVTGTLPEWLAGTFVRNGSGRYSFGPHVELRHWFDGMAYLARFNIEAQAVSFTGRFIRSAHYLCALEGRNPYQSFGTPATRSVGSWLQGLALSNVTDNTNVNVARFGSEAVAITEIGLPRTFDPDTLATGELLHFSDEVGAGPTTAHPVRHGDSWINFTMKLGMRNEYLLWRLSKNGRRDVFARVSAKRPSYVHSIGVSERYAILVEYPFRFDPVGMLLSGRPYIENFHWSGDATLIHLLDLRAERPPVTCTAEPFFAFHHVSAFEDGDAVNVDVVAYDDASIVESLFLKDVRNHPPATNGLSLRRYRVSPATGTATRETLSSEPIELPRVNDRAVRPRYVYAPRIGSGERFADAVLRIDTASGDTRSWEHEDESPGEAIFVARPGATGETDGVVLFVSLNVRTAESALIVLDGETFEEIARAPAGAPLPVGFHGQFWRAP